MLRDCEGMVGFNVGFYLIRVEVCLGWVTENVRFVVKYCGSDISGWLVILGDMVVWVLGVCGF